MTGRLVLDTVGKLAKGTDRFATRLVAPTHWMSGRNRKLGPLFFLPFDEFAAATPFILAH